MQPLTVPCPGPTPLAARIWSGSDQMLATRRGADEACVAAELGGADLHLPRWHRQREPLDVAANAVQEALACRSHAAAEDYYVRVDDVQQVGGAHCQVVRCLFDNSICQGVTSRRRGEDGPR